MKSRHPSAQTSTCSHTRFREYRSTSSGARYAIVDPPYVRWMRSSSTAISFRDSSTAESVEQLPKSHSLYLECGERGVKGQCVRVRVCVCVRVLVYEDMFPASDAFQCTLSL